MRPRGTGTAPIQAGSGEFTCDFAVPKPDPAPVTTIAWRLAHLTVGIFGERVASHFGGPSIDYPTYDYPGTADVALRNLDAAYATWRDGVSSLDADGLAKPVGPAEGRGTRARWQTSCSTSTARRFTTRRGRPAARSDAHRDRVWCGSAAPGRGPNPGLPPGVGPLPPPGRVVRCERQSRPGYNTGMANTFEQVLYEVDDPVATITLNRPDQLNAWTARMGHEVAAAIGEAERDAAVVGIILTGAGHGFCAGADLGMLASVTDPDGDGGRGSVPPIRSSGPASPCPAIPTPATICVARTPNRCQSPSR